MITSMETDLALSNTSMLVTLSCHRMPRTDRRARRWNFSSHNQDENNTSLSKEEVQEEEEEEEEEEKEQKQQ